MVWPFTSTSSNPASTFEKRLSTLSARIKRNSTSLTNLRFQSRKWKALWTLYTALAYLLYVVFLLILTDYRDFTIQNYAVIAISPFLIIIVRFGISAFFDFWIRKRQAKLEALQKEKEQAIEKFKEETKWNSTQELLEKYGGAEPQHRDAAAKEQQKREAEEKKAADHKRRLSSHLPQRTGLPPPPTANIQRPASRNGSTPPPAPSVQVQTGPGAPPIQHPENQALLASGREETTQLRQRNPLPQQQQQQQQQAPPPQLYGEEFAPNADATPQYVDAGPKWYDRLMDVILGEDETKPMNRFALICVHCKLVNGQAPPGMRTLEEVGRWRCAECKQWNGKEREDEVRKLMREVQGSAGDSSESASAPAPAGAGEQKVSDSSTSS